MKFDHHMYTKGTHRTARSTLHLIERAREIGLDGLVITEHDQREAGELLELAGRAAQLRVFSGAVEISAARGYFLVYGSPRWTTPAGSCSPSY